MTAPPAPDPMHLPPTTESKLPPPPPVEYAAVVLASTFGERLHPLTSPHPAAGPPPPPRRVPKHLLPLAGRTVLQRLLRALSDAGFGYCVLVEISADGDDDDADGGASDRPPVGGMSVRRVPVRPGEHGGSASALRAACRHVRTESHVFVVPGDLVVGCPGVLRCAAEAHREAAARYRSDGGGGEEGARGVKGGVAAAAVACTMVLSNVGSEDKEGVPLKESAKQKKGLPRP